MSLEEVKRNTVKEILADNGIQINDDIVDDIVSGVEMIDEYDGYGSQSNVFGNDDSDGERITKLKRFIRRLGWECTHDGSPMVFTFKNNGIVKCGCYHVGSNVKV